MFFFCYICYIKHLKENAIWMTSTKWLSPNLFLEMAGDTIFDHILPSNLHQKPPCSSMVLELSEIFICKN